MSLQLSSTDAMPLEGRATDPSIKRSHKKTGSECHMTATQTTELTATFSGKHLSPTPIIPMPREGSPMTNSWFSWRIGATFQRWAAAQLRQIPIKHEQLDDTYKWSLVALAGFIPGVALRVKGMYFVL